MTENTATPQPDWEALGWITHRQPTADDADGLKEVLVPDAIGAAPRKGKTRLCDYRLIIPGRPWWSVYAVVGGPVNCHPASTQPDRIAALEQRVAELEAQLRPSTEQPEVSVPAAVFISSEALL